MEDRLNAFREFCAANGLTLFEDVQGNQLQPGDWYVAKRNTDVKLLECREYDTELRCVYPTCNGYPYDYYECRKVSLHAT